MHDLSGRIVGVSFDYDGNPMITLKMTDRHSSLAMVDELRDQEVLSMKFGKGKKKKRSLDANAYFHVLVNKIARKVGSSDDEVKKNLVCNYGEYARDDDGNLIGATIPNGMSLDAFYPYTRNYKTILVGNKLCDCYLFYKRTRDMNSKEFSKLLEGTISEAKNLGIETLSKEEVASLMGGYHENEAS